MAKKNPLLIVLGISVLFFVVFVGISIMTVFSLSPGGGQKKLFQKSNAIGVIEITGTILESKKVLEQIEDLSEDPSVKAVLVRINSPGGAVGPSQEIYQELLKLGKTKPVYSSMESVAASGGYYVACGTKKIFSNPGTITGSIGVIMQFADLSKLYQWARVNPYNLKTGKFKDVGNPSREMSADEKELLQSMLDNVLGQFRKAVATARGLSMEKVVALSDGRIFSGEQARDAKLVDELGGFNDALEALGKEAKISGKPVLVYATKKKKLIERLLTDMDEESKTNVVSRVVNLLGGTFGVSQKADLLGDSALSPRLLFLWHGGQ